MASWAGQSSIKGSSETMRMFLLNFTSIGITFVLALPAERKVGVLTVEGSTALPGALK